VIRCLLCGSAASFGYDVAADSVRRSLGALTKDPVVSAIAVRDYRMLRFGLCQLEFADPPTLGSNEFYNWTVSDESLSGRTLGMRRQRLYDKLAPDVACSI